jgi:dTDP-4-amino-4,6-dideoxygalactose transaminase
MPSLDSRTEIIEFAKTNNVQLTFHYVPLHRSPGGIKFGRTLGELTLTQQISETLVRLPLYSDLQGKDTEATIGTISRFTSQ